MTEYVEYSKIERHLSLSKHLYKLDLAGKYIIANIKHKDQTIYNNIINCLSLRKLKLYFCLQYYLDELMYHEIKTINNFYIEDSCYNINKLYFGQTEWIHDVIIQPFQFYEESELNINEAMYLVCYLKEYDGLLLEIEEILKPFKENLNVKKQLLKVINRIRQRHNTIWEVLLDIINSTINNSR